MQTISNSGLWKSLWCTTMSSIHLKVLGSSVWIAWVVASSQLPLLTYLGALGSKPKCWAHH